MYHRYRLAQLCIRLGLGITFIWIGLNIFRFPDNWIGFVPQDLPFSLERIRALQLVGAFDLALGAMLILGIFLRLVALLAALHILGVLVTQGIDAVVIRDVGLLGAALALFFWPSQHRHWR